MPSGYGAPAIHLDQYQHLPDTDWVSRPEAEFVALHDGAIIGESWVMDGNYSRLLPQRMARATGAIVIASNRWLRFGRYLRRTLFNRERPGNLPGAKDSLKWDMVGWVLNRTGKRYFVIVADSGLPHVFCRTARELNALYAAWGLKRP